MRELLLVSLAVAFLGVGIGLIVFHVTRLAWFWIVNTLLNGAAQEIR